MRGAAFPILRHFSVRDPVNPTSIRIFSDCSEPGQATCARRRPISSFPADSPNKTEERRQKLSFFIISSWRKPLLLSGVTAPHKPLKLATRVYQCVLQCGMDREKVGLGGGVHTASGLPCGRWIQSAPLQMRGRNPLVATGAGFYKVLKTQHRKRLTTGGIKTWEGIGSSLALLHVRPTVMEASCPQIFEWRRSGFRGLQPKTLKGNSVFFVVFFKPGPYVCICTCAKDSYQKFWYYSK